ncbi:hypothetical protein EVAR_63581_1 [Eumeta japonica]|uniref:Uncharacterized protein n=1 Tax=Eumeta variegata TaxID=151549 RepID=A0A4C1ZQA4_EUMVA|nr:hypothetical protein EVAR_63581_1 [Eumeta japonica]
MEPTGLRRRTNSATFIVAQVPVGSSPRSVAFGPVPWTSLSILCNCVCKCSFELRFGCRAPPVYESVRYRAVFIVRQQSSYVCSSRVFIPAYCAVCTLRLRPVSTPRVLSSRGHVSNIRSRFSYFVCFAHINRSLSK